MRGCVRYGFEPKGVLDESAVAARFNAHRKERVSSEIGAQLSEKTSLVVCPESEEQTGRVTEQPISGECSAMEGGVLVVEAQEGEKLLLRRWCMPSHL